MNNFNVTVNRNHLNIPKNEDLIIADTIDKAKIAISQDLKRHGKEIVTSGRAEEPSHSLTQPETCSRPSPNPDPGQAHVSLPQKGCAL